MPGPIGLDLQRSQCRPCLDRLAYALERFAAIQPHKRGKTVNLFSIVEQISAKNPHQRRGGHERRESEKHKVTFRALPAPATGARPVEVKIPIAGRKQAVPFFEACEFTAHAQFPVSP
ncbi:MAG: hypothetical protein EA370_08715 [Wenzhouxiangella sp.]|nr:MAG: hypothetical protein EA370_08715 [Wenzhouxiangella sp.]